MSDELMQKLGIQSAAEAQEDNSLLIMGTDASGKTYSAVQVAADYEKVLFVAFGANSLSDYEVANNFDTVTIMEWSQFEKILSAFKQGKLDYECVVLDNYTLAFQLLYPEDSLPSEPQYGKIAVQASTPINVIKAHVEQLVVTMVVIDHPKKGWKLDLTPRSENNILGKFRHKWFCYATKGKAGIEYKVQKVAKLALNFSKN